MKIFNTFYSKILNEQGKVIVEGVEYTFRDNSIQISDSKSTQTIDMSDYKTGNKSKFDKIPVLIKSNVLISEYSNSYGIYDSRYKVNYYYMSYRNDNFVYYAYIDLSFKKHIDVFGWKTWKFKWERINFTYKNSKNETIKAIQYNIEATGISWTHSPSNSPIIEVTINSKPLKIWVEESKTGIWKHPTSTFDIKHPNN